MIEVLTAAVLDAMLKQTQHYDDVKVRHETREERAMLLIAPAHAIAVASEGKRWKIAAMLSLGHSESGGWARYVLEGRCQDGKKGQRCDWNYQLNEPMARGPFQLWKIACPKAYEHPAGSFQSLMEEAKCASKRLENQRNACTGLNPGGELAGMFSGYKDGNCLWPMGRRVQKMAQAEVLFAESLTAVKKAVDEKLSVLD